MIWFDDVSLLGREEGWRWWETEEEVYRWQVEGGGQ